jgi:hypothetical protein
MSSNKSKCLLKIHFLDNEVDQTILAKYLKTGAAKDQVLTATSAYLYPMALAQQPMISVQELELALFNSVLALLGQAVNLLNFFRLYKGITLAPEQLAILGSMFQYSNIAQSPNTARTPLNSNVENVTADEDEDLRLPEHTSFEIEL